jgi:hypothetical protein
MSSPLGLLLPSEGTLIVEDFLSNATATTGAVGTHRWIITDIGNASTLAFQTARGHGVLRATTAATADGDGGALSLFTDALVLRPGVAFGARVRRPVELASLNWRIGLDDSVTATRPTVGITLESDAGVLTCRTDSADHGDNSATVTGHPDLTSGTNEVVGDWLEFYAQASGRANAQGGPDEVNFFVGSTSNDAPAKMHHVATVPCAIDDDEEVEPKIVHWQDSGGADAVIVEFDYYWLWLPRQGSAA